jgi:hypothetical protein
MGTVEKAGDNSVLSFGGLYGSRFCSSPVVAGLSHLAQNAV